MTQTSMLGIGRIALQERVRQLETLLAGDVMGCMGPIVFGLDELVREAIESIEVRNAKLVVVLDTNGGVVEVVERMVDTIRQHYSEVVFAIPDRAMSAGTIFALSGDAIMMDYFSVLGPIDPQIQKKDGGGLVPAQSYVDEYDRLVEVARQQRLTTVELALLQKLDLGELQQFREAKELSIDLLQTWLVKYKFKDWNETETRKVSVSDDDRKVRAKEIAEKLSDQKRWHSHGRGIPMKTLTSEALRLKIDDYGSNRDLAIALRSYFHLLRDFMRQNELQLFVHTRNF